jgi:hypothetical protein
VGADFPGAFGAGTLVFGMEVGEVRQAYDTETTPFATDHGKTRDPVLTEDVLHLFDGVVDIH